MTSLSTTPGERWLPLILAGFTSGFLRAGPLLRRPLAVSYPGGTAVIIAAGRWWYVRAGYPRRLATQSRVSPPDPVNCRRRAWRLLHVPLSTVLFRKFVEQLNSLP